MSLIAPASPPEVAEDRCDIKYSNWMIPGEIYRGKFPGRSYLDIQRVFSVVPGLNAPRCEVSPGDSRCR